MLSLLAIGDFGASTPIRDSIARLIQSKKKDAVLGLGDNFYNYGIDTVQSPRWNSDFLQIYKPSCPWYMILGNHDYLGNIKSQIEFTKTRQGWVMPNRYYDHVFPLDNSSVHLFCLDTFELSLQEAKNNSLGMDMSIENWEDLEKSLQPNQQLSWLETRLSQSKSKWKIITGHYPILSCGSHGNNPELAQRLLPLFEKYEVDFYVSGHDHNIQHATLLNTQLMVAGTGCSVSPLMRKDERCFPISQVPGVGFFHFFSDRVQFGFCGLDGNTIYQKWLCKTPCRFSYLKKGR